MPSPPNQILVPSDGQLNRGTRISATDGSVLNAAINLVTCEFGSIVASGIYGLNQSPLSFQLYNPDDSPLATTVPFVAPWDRLSPTASDYAHTFYVSRRRLGVGNAQVRTVLDDGTLGATIWTLDIQKLFGMAVNVAGTVLYYGEDVNAAPIRTWDLVGNAPGPVFVPGVADTHTGDELLVLPASDDVLVIVQSSIIGNTWEIRRYNAAGALQHTYPLGVAADAASDIRLALDLADSTVFWVRTFADPTGDTSVFTKFDTASGAVLLTFTVPTGVFAPNVPPSCPFFAASGQTIIIDVVIPPLPPPPGPITVQMLERTGLIHVYGYDGVRTPPSPLGLAPGARLDVFDRDLPKHRLTYVKVDGSQPFGNAFVADQNGYFSCYVVPEPIDLQESLGGITPRYTIQDALVLDPRVLALENDLHTTFQAIQAGLSSSQDQLFLVGGLGVAFPFGGSLTNGVRVATQIDVPNPETLVLVAPTQPTSTAYRLTVWATCRTEDPATSVTPVVYNTLTGAIVGTGVPVVSLTNLLQFFAMTLDAGQNTYRLALVPSNANAFVYGNGSAFLGVI